MVGDALVSSIQSSLACRTCSPDLGELLFKFLAIESSESLHTAGDGIPFHAFCRKNSPSVS